MKHMLNKLGLIALLVLAVGGPMVFGTSRAESPKDLAKATFAGGCFWCMEEVFEKVDGVVDVRSGYIGGQGKNPTYEEVSAGGTGHAEAVEIVYDPKQVTYAELLKAFWRNVDPTTPDRQFCDRGDQYRPAIFYQNEEQQQLAESSKQVVEETKSFSDPIQVEIVQATDFYEAETYHQDFYKKNPIRYKFYKWNCGRAQRLEELWGET